jgi:rhodanese-related sulfurtransferase
MSVRTISREELKRKMDQGDRFVLVDVLEPQEFERDHLPGAINVPWGRLHEVPQLVPDRHTEVVFYCASPT